jgi:hypothetical protein
MKAWMIEYKDEDRNPHTLSSGAQSQQRNRLTQTVKWVTANRQFHPGERLFEFSGIQPAQVVGGRIDFCLRWEPRSWSLRDMSCREKSGKQRGLALMLALSVAGFCGSIFAADPPPANPTHPSSTHRPNIVFILTDDMACMMLGHAQAQQTPDQ